jgi:hypothetical protein
MRVVGNFLSTLSVQEKQRIKERTDTLVKLLAEWARRYACIRPSRIPMTALTTAVALPRLSVPDVLTTAQMILWIFGVDDKADEQIFTLEEMRRKTEQWHLIARYGQSDGADASDELTSILLQMREKLSKSPTFEPLCEYWASRLRIIFEAMAQEYRYALEYKADGRCALPSLDEYVRGGTHSIGFPLWGATVLILLKDYSVVKHLESISEATEYTGATIRLYNDVRTLEKEIQEKSINSIIILYHAILARNPNASRESAIHEAKQYILQLADSYAQKCRELLAKIRTDSRQFEESTSNIVALHAYFYGHSEYDYHTTSQSDTNGWLNSAA